VGRKECEDEGGTKVEWGAIAVESAVSGSLCMGCSGSVDVVYVYVSTVSKHMENNMS
jgi:hypothetical protein